MTEHTVISYTHINLYENLLLTFSGKITSITFSRAGSSALEGSLTEKEGMFFIKKCHITISGNNITWNIMDIDGSEFKLDSEDLDADCEDTYGTLTN